MWNLGKFIVFLDVLWHSLKVEPLLAYSSASSASAAALERVSGMIVKCFMGKQVIYHCFQYV